MTLRCNMRLDNSQFSARQRRLSRSRRNIAHGFLRSRLKRPAEVHGSQGAQRGRCANIVCMLRPLPLPSETTPANIVAAITTSCPEERFPRALARGRGHPPEASPATRPTADAEVALAVDRAAQSRWGSGKAERRRE